MCLVTDGFVRYEDDGSQERVPSTTSRVVVLDTGDGHVVTEWSAEEAAQLVLVDDLAVVGTPDTRGGVVVVAHDVRTGDERWRCTVPIDAGSAGVDQDGVPQYWGLVAAGSTVVVHAGDAVTVLSSTGSLVRDDLRLASRGGGFGTDPLTGAFSISSFASGESVTRLLALDADPAGDVVVPGDLLYVTLDDGSLPGLVLTFRSHLYASDRTTGEELWEADGQRGLRRDGGPRTRLRDHADGGRGARRPDRRGRLAHPAADLRRRSARHRRPRPPGAVLPERRRRRREGDGPRPRDRARGADHPVPGRACPTWGS